MTETQDLLISKIELYLQNAVISFGLLKGYLQGGARTARAEEPTANIYYSITDKTDGNARECSHRSDIYANGILKFSEKELSKMPKKIKNQFRVGAITAHIRKKPNGVFEIRCQIDRTPISESSKDFETAKAKFIQAINDLFATPAAVKLNKHVKLNDYMRQWLEAVKKPTVKQSTFKDYVYTTNTYIYPAFEGRELSSVKGFELQVFFNSFTESEKHRTARKIYNLLSPLFDYAVDDEIINKSPMQRIALPNYEQKHGVPLTRTEEKKLIDELKAHRTPYAQAYTFMLYTGIRRSELATITISDGWINIVTSKQRKGLKEKTRAMPISPMLAKVLPLIDIKSIKKILPDMLTNHIKEFFKTHHSHDLRHTFITRAQECGIQRELVSLWAGHASDSSQTSLVYTHLEQYREHQEEEMKKFDYFLG